MATTIPKIAEQLVNLKVKEVQELLEVLKNEYNIEPAASAPVAVAATAAQGEGEAEKKVEVDIWIKEIGINKMNLIKAVKEVAGVGLIDAKKLVDANKEAPIKKGVPTAEANTIADTLKAAGATVELK